MTKPSVAPGDPVTAAVDLPRPPLRRLARDLMLLVVAKIVVISLIWWVVASQYERPDTRPAAMEHLLAPAPSSSSTQADSP